MAIPDKALEIKINAETMTLDEMALFSPGGFNAFEFRAFLREHSNWTQEELSRITRAEVGEIYAQAFKLVLDALTPLAK